MVPAKSEPQSSHIVASSGPGSSKNDEVVTKKPPARPKNRFQQLQGKTFHLWLAKRPLHQVQPKSGRTWKNMGLEFAENAHLMSLDGFYLVGG